MLGPAQVQLSPVLARLQQLVQEQVSVPVSAPLKQPLLQRAARKQQLLRQQPPPRPCWPLLQPPSQRAVWPPAQQPQRPPAALRLTHVGTVAWTEGARLAVKEASSEHAKAAWIRLA